MLNAIDLLERVFDVLDLLFHWRTYVPMLAGLALALLLQSLYPEYFPSWTIVAFGAVGLICGLFWEWSQ
jgi:general stress protein CsbA